jgi:hypothetical protein
MIFRPRKYAQRARQSIFNTLCEPASIHAATGPQRLGDCKGVASRRIVNRTHIPKRALSDSEISQVIKDCSP